MATDTTKLITDLEHMDEDEARIHGRLLKELEELEELELRKRSVTVADMDALQAAIDSLGAKLTAARAAGAGSASTPTFAQLEAQVREHDASAQRVRELLAERMKRLAPAPPPSEENGHGPAAEDRLKTFHLDRPLMKGDDVRNFQRLLNHRYAAWGINRQVAVNGIYEPQTAAAAHQVALALGLLKSDYEHGITPGLRILIHRPERRSASQRQRALSAERRRYRAALRRRYAHKARAAGTPRAANANANGNASSRTAEASGGTIAAAIRKNGGHYEDAIVREAGNFDLPVSLVCAIVEIESSFTNVFGHDGVTNTIKSHFGQPNLVVTQELYEEYRRQRDLGKGNQGVGPMQLTDTSLQADADRSGGCWKAEINIRVGCKELARHIARLGLERGIQRYNGSADYPPKVLPLKRKWDRLLAGTTAGMPGTHATPTPRPTPRPTPGPRPSHGAGGAPPTFTLRREPITSAAVREFQRVLNMRFAGLGIGRTIDLDGVYGVDTARAARQVALALGLQASDYEHGITPRVRVLLRTPSSRSAAQKQRAKSARVQQYRARLHKRYGGAHAGARRAARAKPARGGKLVYPLAVHGTYNGGVRDHHANANGISPIWQNVNAVDINVPVGTPVFAVADGTIAKLGGGTGGRGAGLRVTLEAGDRTWFYGHLSSRVPLKVGQKVTAGQPLGTSGSAAGVAHLHIASSGGDPAKLLGV